MSHDDLKPTYWQAQRDIDIRAEGDFVGGNKNGRDTLHASTINVNNYGDSEPRKTPRLPTFALPSFLDTSHFVGRKAELAALDEAWHAGQRFVLIHGLAGMGKSTLASRFLQHHRQLPSERVTRYDFYERAYFADFLRGVGGYYELAPEGDDAAAFRTALLHALLEDRDERVLVLENFEFALDKEDRIADEHIRYVLEGLIQGQGQLRLLITSRRMPNLGRYTMRLHRPLPTGLEGLPRADADELLAELTLSEGEKTAIYDLLGGHPTAVGLLAALLQDPFEILPLSELIPQLQTLRGQAGRTPFLEQVTAELLDRLYQQLSPPSKRCCTT